MNNTAIEVLKWIGVVLAAGFVGYFGRYLAMMLIERLRRKRAEATTGAGSVREAPASPEERLAEIQLKAGKKRAKAEAKKAKKAQPKQG